MIIKCKMCGGDIELSADKTYGTCDYCGSTMTFPKVDDDHRANLFNRANHFRRQNEFDKAVSAYERILNEDNTDAEAHWGVVLSRFGIEYVEDPVSHERIPTCHRVQVTSILTDADYLAALEYAPDDYSRDLYTAEAKRIADIQKGILAISAQEKPYDVFICYKESSETGSRTKDSTIAQDIYYQLKQEGFNVFFARITLEDKLGQQYEPYIFAALNSAKVMLVVGTKPEYFSAVWVKNEWSRYLALMKQDRSRLLIPCYRDMDPYDLPDELSMLQSQDMSRIGFMQDLIRGVKKVLAAADTQQAEKASPAASSPAGSAAPLIRRVFMFLEDGDWTSADEYCERVLDINPENARAYLGKLMVELQVRNENDLGKGESRIEQIGSYKKALRYADGALAAQLRQYAQEREQAIDAHAERAAAVIQAYVSCEREKQQLQKAKERITALKNSITDKKNRIAALDQKLGAMHHETLEQEQEELTQQIRALSRKKENADALLAERTAENDKLGLFAMAKKVRLEKMIAASAAESAQLEADLLQTQSRLRECQAQQKQCQTYLDQKQEYADAMQEKKAQLEAIDLKAYVVHDSGVTEEEYFREVIFLLEKNRWELVSEEVSNWNGPQFMQISPEQRELALKTLAEIKAVLTDVQAELPAEGKAYFVSKSPLSAACAKSMLQVKLFGVKVGELYCGRVAATQSDRALVELFPGQQGTVTVDQLKEGRTEKVEKVCKFDDRIWVKVMSSDKYGHIQLSRKEALKMLGNQTTEAHK